MIDTELSKYIETQLETSSDRLDKCLGLQPDAMNVWLLGVQIQIYEKVKNLPYKTQTDKAIVNTTIDTEISDIYEDLENWE
jgi:hypothetical protein